MDKQPSPAAEIEELLRRYLLAHPQANDTERGIREWWLRDAHRSYSPADVHAAIDRLVASGELAKLVLPDGQYSYAGSGASRNRNF
jgi:hypothetical protein